MTPWWGALYLWGVVAVLAELTPVDVLKLVSDYGAVGLMAVAIVAFLRQDLVPGKLYRAVIADRDKWEARALRGTELAEAAVHEAEQKAMVQAVAEQAAKAAVEAARETKG